MSLREERPWGYFDVIHDRDIKIKILTIMPGASTSVQKHRLRNEHWIFPESNSYRFIKAGEIHQLENTGHTPMKVIEVQTGSYFGEDDIVRYYAQDSDKHLG